MKSHFEQHGVSDTWVLKFGILSIAHLTTLQERVCILLSLFNIKVYLMETEAGSLLKKDLYLQLVSVKFISGLPQLNYYFILAFDNILRDTVNMNHFVIILLGSGLLCQLHGMSKIFT